VFEIAGSGFVVPVAFAGTPGKPHCDDKSVSALARPYRGLNPAAAALGYTDVNALQNAILAFCGANLGFDVERHCAAFAARAIDNAEREILVGAYGRGTGPRQRPQS
jgi:hypothetical protein